MVSEQEIEKVAKLMKIEITDYSPHIVRVKKMLDYFDILDNTDILDESITPLEMPIALLREDKHVPYDSSTSMTSNSTVNHTHSNNNNTTTKNTLITKIHNYKGTYVQSPKLVT